MKNRAEKRKRALILAKRRKKARNKMPRDLDKLTHISLTPAEIEELRTDSLGEKLSIVIAKLPSDQITLEEMKVLMGQDGLLLLVIFLSLVFMVPVQLPGMGGLFGFVILLIGISRLSGRSLWLPRRIAQHVMPAEGVRETLRKSTIWLKRLEYVSHPHRLNMLAAPGVVDIFNSLTIIYGALMLILPIILVPLSNTLPALGVLFICIGLLQRDGLCILYGHLVNIATIAYFAALVYGGHEACDKFWHWIKALC
jgi:hypothetical protein